MTSTGGKMAFALAVLGMAACAQSVPSEEPDCEGGQCDKVRADDRLVFDCVAETQLEGPPEQEIAVSGTTRVSVAKQGDRRTITYSGDLLRLYSPTDDGLSVVFEQDGWFDESWFVLLARAPGEGDWRQVIIPVTAESQWVWQDEDEWTSFSAEIDFLYWIRVGRGVWATRQGEDEAQEFDGLFFGGWPTRQDLSTDKKLLLYADPFAEDAPFVPFEEIPALADIAHEPLEWAIAGVTSQTYLPFDGLAGEYGYTLRAGAPGGVEAVGATPSSVCSQGFDF